MFQLLKKYRKGVSPVIAVVLLIALTVAAAAVIWTLTSGILDDASGNTLVVSNSASASNNTDGSTLTVVVTLRANSATTLDSAKTTVLSGPGGVGEVATSVTTPLASGDTSVTIVFASGTPNTFDSGTYKINLSWSGDGDDPKLLEISATA